ncbi:MAG: hypothetical protein E7167_00100 [Firmicutes bacterium]|nr:hypothetical protein [Bacillota bacterium]
MNKSDMLKAAQEVEKYGVDPDTIMVTYTLDEFAESHGEEVDTFDEDALAIKQIGEALQDLSFMIEALILDIDATKRLHEGARNWAERYELGQEVRQMELELMKYRDKEIALTAKRAQLEEEFKNKYVR